MILGLHHVTATVDAPQADLDFCVDGLGLRLVKKTVNFDNHHVYHFYYGDERGAPGTIWTTFPYKDQGVPQGRQGTGQVTVTSFSVPDGSLNSWKTRLREHGFPVRDVEPRFGEDAIAVSDPSGLTFELVANDRDARVPWMSGDLDASTAIRGLHSVTLTVRSPAKTLELMTRLLGFEVVNETDGRIRVAVNGDAPGKTIDIVHGPTIAPSKNGLGTVHHVAMAISGADDQLELRRELLQLGVQVTDVRDRCYFQSIYFREPGGVLFEAATVEPGFLIDEALPALGRSLKLPPWEEPYRAEIEAGLARVKG